MKFTLGLLAFFTYLVTIQCSLQTIVANPGGIGGIFKGPDSETIVKGPDGSIITSEQKGGIVQTDYKLEPIIVADTKIVEAHPDFTHSLVEDGYIAPLVPVENVDSTSREANNIVPVVNSDITLTSPTVNHISPAIIAPLEQNTVPISLGHSVNIIEPEPHIIETEIVDAPAIEPKESTDLVGPSGSISTRGSESIVSGPASTTITKTAKVLVAPPVISTSAVIPTIIAPARPLVNTANLGYPTSHPTKAVGLLGPTLAPPVASTPLPLGALIQQQPVHHIPSQPPAILQSEPTFATGLLTGEQFDARYQIPAIIKSPAKIHPLQVVSDQSVIVKETPRVNIEDEGTSGFINPDLIYGTGTIASTTRSPIFSTTSSFYGGIPSSTISPITPVISSGINDNQYVLNPSNIPTRNIIPPEIGVPRGTIDLGVTVASVTKKQDRPVAPEFINVQGIDTDNIQRAEHINDRTQIIDNDNTVQNGYYQTEVLGTRPNSLYSQQKVATLNGPLLIETNPILYQNGQYGIPQYVTNQHAGTVSLSSESDISSHSIYNELPAGNLQNRYHRIRINRKY